MKFIVLNNNDISTKGGGGRGKDKGEEENRNHKKNQQHGVSFMPQITLLSLS